MMGRDSIRLLLFILIGSAMAWIFVSRYSPAVEPPASAAIPRSFIVFDATLYKDKPSLEAYHVRPITVLYESRLFVPNQSPSAMPPEVIVRSLAYERRGVPEPVILDIERWPIKGDAPAVQSTVAKFLSVFSWVKGEAPGVPFGFYGTVPIPDYWRAIRDPGSPEFRSWQQDNDRLEAVSDQVDALFPSIYTFYLDRQGWVTYAIAQITEARRKAKGKPVYAFVMPRYHESNLLLGSRFLSSDYWELELTTVAQHADGVVIWGGWGTNGPEPWDEEAAWWQVTKRFTARRDSSAPAAHTDILIR